MKTYFLFDKNECVEVSEGVYECNLPSEFAAAIGEKWFVVRYCFATFDKYLIGDVVLHSDLIKRDSYLDHAISVINVLNNGAKPDKYFYPEGSPKRFKIWFTDLNNKKVIPDAFQVKMLLILGQK